ncbi:hypothetical protein KFK09_015247 [Dendrobium nobile]|uniref:DUF4283 domain-containing protein n=1 Tax=Dendrobium nobile TaxID=94219 RepID=A0A8T3B5L4_DENNO|nr:hypothetical protein KFK09_015247 [Dendrobium nobile]
MSFFSPSHKLSFKSEDLSEGSSLWSHSLVGYSIGQRPYYERLLSAMKKAWNLKGPGHGLDGRTLVFARETLYSAKMVTEIPTSISKIASYVGIPISVDALTANRTRLTFARVCVQINKNSPLPDVIPIEIDRDDLNLKVVYDWKPTPCEGCGSLFHPFSLCSANPNPKPPIPSNSRPRGRSTSHHPNPRNLGQSSKPPVPRPSLEPPILGPPPALQTVATSGIGILPMVTPPLNSPTKSPKAVTPATQGPPPKPNSPLIPPLPNLNFPTEVSSSSDRPASFCLPPPLITTSNKFASLLPEEENIVDSSCPPLVTPLLVDKTLVSSIPKTTSSPNEHSSSSENASNSNSKSTTVKDSKKGKAKPVKKAKGSRY